MIHFTSLIAFSAFLGLLVPFLIHLWERRKAPRVQVGSVRWMEASQDAKVSRLRFTDLWRFLLRAGIVALFVFLLAGPVWRTQQPPPVEKVWALVDPGVEKRDGLFAVLDSMQGAGVPVKWMRPGMPAWDKNVEGQNDEPAPAWSYLREVATLPALPDTVKVFTLSRLNTFHGFRPALPFQVVWNILPEPPASFHLVSAWEKEDFLDLLIAHSSGEGLSFYRLEAPKEAGEVPLADPFPTLELSRSGNPGGAGPWQLSFLGEGTTAISVQQPPSRRVAVVSSPAYRDDLPYLEAALRAISGFLDLPIEMESFEQIDGQLNLTSANRQENLVDDHLFWFSEGALSDSLREHFGSRILMPGAIPYRQGGYVECAPGHWLWRLEPGALAKEPLGNAGLPEALLHVLYADEVVIPDSLDRRAMERVQAAPRFVDSFERPSVKKDLPARSLHFPLWLLLTGLFLVERLTAKSRMG